MKFVIQKQNREGGSALMVTLFVTTTLLIGIGSYLLLVRAQYVSVARSQAWNGAMTMAESGAEEALAQLNPGASVAVPVIDRTANGWGAPSGGFYGPVSRAVTNSGSYSVVFSDVTYPIIYSTGYVTVPNLSATLTRVIQVATTNVPLYNVAMAARTNIDLNGNGPSANSFNSALTNLSYDGRYTNTMTASNGDVAVLYGTLDLGNHDILGDVYLGPTATLNKGTNQVYGTVNTDYTYDFPDVIPPDTTGWFTLYTPATNTLAPDGNLYTYVFTNNADYVVPNMSGSVYVGTNAHVRLLVQSGGTQAILVAGNGAPVDSKLIIYIASPTFTIGSGTIDGGRAANLAYYGLTNNTAINFSGNAAFTGTIYAPDAAVTLTGGGSNDYDFVGSLIAKSIKLNGHFQFHFDEDLLAHGPTRGYTAVRWAEL
jgi:hypothetical protein